MERISYSPETVMLRLSGHLLSENDIKSVRKEIEKIEQQTEVKCLVSDFSEVTAISPEVIKLFAQCQADLKSHSQEMLLTGLSEEIELLMNSLNMDSLLHNHLSKDVQLEEYLWSHDLKTEEINCSLPADILYVPAIRQMAQRYLLQKGYSDKDAFHVETIIDELCNNAIEHGSGGNADDIGVVMWITCSHVKIIITNKISPSKVKKINSISQQLNSAGVDPHSTRGRGLLLVKMLANEVTVNHSESGTSVHVTKVREG